MVAVHPFIWALGLRLWSDSEIARRNFNFWRFFKILYQGTSKRFRVFKIYFMFDGLILFCKDDFRSEVCL